MFNIDLSSLSNFSRAWVTFWNAKGGTNILSYKPWRLIDNDRADLVIRIKFENCCLRISHSGYLHLVILITTAETNQSGGELNGVGLTGLSGTGVLSDLCPAHHNSDD
jgi:hypothetical protein